MPEPQVSSEAVKARTGKTWEEWFSLMDAAGCAELDHKGIVAVLHEKFQVEDWWQQMITVSYEQARGKRLLHQRPDGYQIGKSRTMSAKVDDVFNAWEDPTKRKRWLADPEITIRKATKNRSLRVTWIDGETSLDVAFYPKGENVQVSLNHSKLPNSDKAEEMKKYWALQLENLENFLK
jgi:uncharacterized protein YndB with AHSA1/START domain